MASLNLIPIILFTSLLIVGLADDNCMHILEDNIPVQFSFAAEASLIFCMNTSIQITHVVFQAHTYQGNLTASMDSALRPGRFITGSDIGLVSVMKDYDELKWYLKGRANKNVIVMATAYGASDPLPGGCNLEMPLKNDPNIYLYDQEFNVNTVRFSYGNEDVSSKCGSQRQDNLSYDVYQYFMNERDLSAGHYYDVMEKVMDADFVRRNAAHVTSLSWHDVTRLKFAAYRGLGTVFIVIVTSNSGSTVSQASYVPVVTYSCDNLEDGCVEAGDFWIKIGLSVLAVVGLVICFCGHHFFKTEMFFFGYLATVLTVYIVLDRIAWWDSLICLYCSAGVGLLGGIIWLVIWIFVGIPLLSVLIPALLLGYLVACFILNASPLGNLSWSHTDLTFQLMFFAIVIIFVILLGLSARKINVFACAFVGSFLVVLIADVCLNGGVKYILMNTIWRSTTPDFVTAYSILPVQLSDILLFVICGLLVIAGCIVHYFLERNRPSFPDCPWKKYQQSRGRHDSEREIERSEGTGDEDDERRPLLFRQPRRQTSQDPARVYRHQPVEQFQPPEVDTTEWWQLPADSLGSALPVVSDTGTPPPAYEEDPEPEPVDRVV